MAKKPTAPNFESVLDTPSTEVSRPRPLPQGTYLCIVTALPRIDKSTQKGTEFSEYTLKTLEAADDVDEDELKLALTKGNGDVMPLSDRSVRVTFYHTEDSLYRLKKFLNDLQIDGEDDDGNVRTIGQMMQDVPNRQVYAHIKHAPSPDGETIYANVDKTAKVS